MDETQFDGTLVLEKLAEVKLVDAFFYAIDSDDFGKARSLMKSAGVDADAIEEVIERMNEATGEH